MTAISARFSTLRRAGKVPPNINDVGDL